MKRLFALVATALVAVALYAARPGLAPERVVEHVPLRVGVERRDGVPGPFARRLPA